MTTSRTAIVCSEPIRRRMAGIGIRYLEFHRQLSAAGLDTVLFSPGDPEETRELDLPDAEVRRFVPERAAELLADCQVAVAQGQLANEILHARPELPVAIDLYDPWLVENLHYADSLGPQVFDNDHAAWSLQLSRGDFFLCASEEQRLYYLGLLTAYARVRPEVHRDDPNLERLIATVPFGVPDVLPAHRGYLPLTRPGERRILFGGVYDWYDPQPVLEALAQLDRPQWKLLLLKNPNPEGTPQERLGQIERWCRERGPDWWGGRVELVDWAPSDRRFDLLRDVDILVSTHQLGLETSLSLRVRFLDALAAGCPVVLTRGGTVSRLVEQWGAGWVVPPEDPAALARALGRALNDGPERERRRQRGIEEIGRFHWSRVVEPLLEFCRRPRIDQAKRLSIEAPARPLARSAPDVWHTVPLRKVSVAIPSWNGLEHLRDCLPAVTGQSDPGVEWEVLLLDNGSNDGTALWMVENYPQVRLLRSPHNLGFAAACNHLAQAADGDAIAFLNNDTRPRPDWLARLVEALGSAPPDVAAVAGTIVNWSGDRLDTSEAILTFDGHALPRDHLRPLEEVTLSPAGSDILLPCGGNMLIRRDRFLQAGGFDPGFFAYFEDVDLGWRLWLQGQRLTLAPQAVVHHRSQATSGLLGQYNRGVLFERNSFLVAYKNYQPGLWEQMMPAVLLTLLWRTQSVLVHNNRDGELLTQDPYAGRIANTSAEPLPPTDDLQLRAPLDLFGKWVDYGPAEFLRRGAAKIARQLPLHRNGLESDSLEVTDPQTISQLRAVSYILAHLERSAGKRKAVQQSRRRSDEEIFERFPLHVVPTYPRDEILFSSPAFTDWLPDELSFCHRQLDEILSPGS